jgi:arsenate reductase
MAEGLLRADAGDLYETYSAGTQPRGVHPLAIEVMAEVGIDIGGHRSDHVDAFDEIPMDYVITVCDSAAENCPYVPARKKLIHRSFSDPSATEGTHEEMLVVFRRARDEIRAWLRTTFIPLDR